MTTTTKMEASKLVCQIAFPPFENILASLVLQVWRRDGSCPPHVLRTSHTLHVWSHCVLCLAPCFLCWSTAVLNCLTVRMGDFETLRQEGEALEKKIVSSRKACADTTLRATADSIPQICVFFKLLSSWYSQN